MKHKIIKWLLGITLVLAGIVCLHAVIVLNDPYAPFRGKTSAQVGDMITDGASELLQSAADAFLFLNEMEVAERDGLNVNAALQRVDLAAARVEQALRLFREIIISGREAGYESRRISKLRGFDYSRFAEENGLNREVMGEVSNLLGKGNVLGFYHRHAGNLQELLATLQRIRADLLAGKRSDNGVLWSLLQQYNKTLLFGNYASLIFYKI